MKAVVFVEAAVLGSAGERLDHRLVFLGLKNITMIVNVFHHRPTISKKKALSFC
jgi:hypothetical protein